VEMTPKERWLAALRLQPLDRLPFWPKLDRAYSIANAGSFADTEAIHAFIHSDRLASTGICNKVTRSRTATNVSTQGNVTTHIYRTRFGHLVRADRFDEISQSRHPVEFPIKRREDLAIMTEWYLDQEVELDAAAAEHARAAHDQAGDDAVTAASIDTSPLMEFVQHLAGVENAHLLLSDCPAEVEGLFGVMHRIVLRRAEIESAHNPADFLILSENTSTTLISPAQYHTYCLPHLMEYARIAGQANRPLVLHMCGHLKALLPDLACLPVAGFEAFTTPPVGNTTLLDARSACPNTCLIGGTSAVSWTRSAPAIIAELELGLSVLPHHRGLVITSGGVMPQRCLPETIKAVCDWVRQYPIRAS